MTTVHAYDVQVFHDQNVIKQGAASGGRLSISHTNPAYMVYDQPGGTTGSDIHQVELDATGVPVNFLAATCFTCNRTTMLLAQLGTGQAGNPEYDQRGENIIFSVQITTAGFTCNPGSGGTGIGDGPCLDVWIAHIHGGAGGTALDSLSNLTNFATMSGGAQMGSLHPRFSNSTTNPYVVWSQKLSNNPSSGSGLSYCMAHPNSCALGVWEMQWCQGSYTLSAPYFFTVTSCHTYSNSSIPAWYESSGDFTGTWDTALGGTDSGWIMFCSNLGSGQPYFTPSLWALSVSGASAPVALTSPQDSSGTYDIWSEHIHIDQSGTRVSYSTTTGWNTSMPPFPPLDRWIAQLHTPAGASPYLSDNRQMTFYNQMGNPEYAGFDQAASDNAWLPNYLCPVQMTSPCNQIMSYITVPTTGYGGTNLTTLFQIGAAISGHARLSGDAQLKSH